MYEPLVSVVVPTYQHVRYVRQCLDSILSQRVDFDIEILLGDDGSTDGTREICIEIASAYPDRIRLFLNDRSRVIYINGHATGRRNVLDLYAQARGRYVAVCEADDFWLDENKLALQVESLEKDPTLSGSYHGTAMVDSNGASLGRVFGTLGPKRAIMNDVISAWTPFHISAFVFRKNEFLRHPPKWIEKIGSYDLALFVICAAEGDLLGIDRVMSAYRKHERGVTDTGLHQGTSHELNRVLLWLSLDLHFMGKYSRFIDPVIRFHLSNMMKNSTRLFKVKTMTQIYRAVPISFLRKLTMQVEYWRRAFSIE